MVSQEVYDRLKNQLGDWDPNAPAPIAKSDERAAVGGGTFEDASVDLGARLLKGIHGGVEGAQAIAKYGGFGPAGQIISRAEEAYGKSNLPGAETVGKLTTAPELPKDAADRAKNPKTFVGKLLGGAAEGVGGMMTMPVGGGMARNIIAGMGMGEGAEIASSIMGNLFNYFGGEKYRAVGEGAGSMAGGVAGAQLNISRVAAMAESGSQAYKAIKSIKPAYDAARIKQAELRDAGEEAALWPIFVDEFGALRATTRGLIQKFTNRQIAGIIRQDYRASQNADSFIKDSKVTGIDEKDWGLGERTMVPQITEAMARANPSAPKQKEELAAAASARKSSIVNAYQRLKDSSDLPANAEGIEAAAETFRIFTQNKVNALSAETGQVKEAFPILNVRQEHSLGETARGIRDKLAGDSYQIASGKYLEAETRADAEGVAINIGPVREQATEILQNFYSKVDPGKVPPVVKDLLKATEVKKGGAAELLLPDDLAAERASAKQAADAAGKPLTLKEANDLSRALGEAAGNARSSENYVAFNRAKELEAQVQASIAGSKMSPETMAAYGEARRYWAKEHAPRFQEGLGKALGKERGGVYEGREALKAENVFDEVLSSETAMRDFDTTFGRDPQARQLLVVALEDKFRKTVMKDGVFSERMFEANLDEFKRKYESGLARLPESADKINEQAGKMVMLQGEKRRELARYKDIMRGPVTEKIGAIQAKKLFQQLLANPQKMSQFLTAAQGSVVGSKDIVKEVFQQANPFKDGEYDPDALLKLVRAGKRTSDSPSSMELLFTEAFGKEDGHRQIDTLEAIARFTQREAETNPRFMQAGSAIGDSPVKRATGAGAASWANDLRAVATGRTGANYAALLGLSRFANAKVQNAVEAAKRKALYDPDEAKAILELVATPSSQSISMTTARKLFGDIRTSNGQTIVDRLVDKGYVKAYVSRGLIYGGEKAMQEDEDPESRQNLRRKASEAR